MWLAFTVLASMVLIPPAHAQTRAEKDQQLRREFGTFIYLPFAEAQHEMIKCGQAQRADRLEERLLMAATLGGFDPGAVRANLLREQALCCKSRGQWVMTPCDSERMSLAFDRAIRHLERVMALM